MGAAHCALWAALSSLLACVVLLTSGCGGIVSSDLFIVSRTGRAPGAKLTMLVSEEGVVHCYTDPAHPGPARHLSDPQIIEARAIQEDLESSASHHESLRAKPGSVLAYYMRDQFGSVSFADNSSGQPAAMRKLALFVLSVAQGVCHLPQQGA